jgi:predicted RNA-binding Zn-ribbon protein involved in translation (DUF1610 family)
MSHDGAEDAAAMAKRQEQRAPCGLFCRACVVYIATTEDRPWLERMAARLGGSADEYRCEGCSSAVVNPYCRSCVMSRCARERGVEFCGQCGEYPCDVLREFQAARPHRLELWEAQTRIKEIGYDAWYAEMERHFACPQCGTINVAYQDACRKCGAVPSCGYRERHRESMRAWEDRARQT